MICSSSCVSLFLLFLHVISALPFRFEYLFNFDSMFEIHDDIEVLKRMGMACGLEVGKCSAEDLKVARSLVPKALEPYVTGQWPITFCAELDEIFF